MGRRCRKRQPSHPKIKSSSAIKIAERAGFGNHRIPGFVELVNTALFFCIRNGLSGLVRTELPDKSIINDIGAAGLGSSDV